MRKLSLHLVTMATKPQRVHLKRCEWREPKLQRAGSFNQNTSTVQCKRETKNYLTCGRFVLWILILCVKLVVSFIFADIQRAKLWLFNKSNGVNFMYRWFIYVTMEQSIVPRQGHVIFFVIFTIWPVPVTAVLWPSLGKFVIDLSDILFMV